MVVNGRNWEPDTPWRYPPFPKHWKVRRGLHFHKVLFLHGTVRLQTNRLIIGLPDGTVVKRYRRRRAVRLCARDHGGAVRSCLRDWTA